MRPAAALTELVDRIAFSLAMHKKADEMLILMQHLIQEKIVQVSSGALYSAFNVLLNNDMKAETLEVRTVYVTCSDRLT